MLLDMERSTENKKRIESEEYKKLRARCIEEYPNFYKDNLVFQYCKVGKSDQLLLLEDPEYRMETASLHAELFKDNLSILNSVIKGAYADEAGSEKAPVILKAIDMRNQLLLSDVGVNDDLKSRLNIAFTKMSKEDFQNLSTIEINEGNGNTDLSANFGVSGDNMSREEEAKAKLAQAQLDEKIKERNKEE